MKGFGPLMSLLHSKLLGHAMALALFSVLLPVWATSGSQPSKKRYMMATPNKLCCFRFSFRVYQAVCIKDTVMVQYPCDFKGSYCTHL